SKTRVTRAGGRSAENPFVQLLCAETAAAVDEMTTILHRNFRNLHAYARRGETPPLEERLRYKFQSTAVTERCTLLAARIFKATGAAGLQEGVPFGGGPAGRHRGRGANFIPGRIRRQQLGRRDVRSREQGPDGVADSRHLRGAAAQCVARRMRCQAQLPCASFTLMAASTSAKALRKSSTSRFSCAHVCARSFGVA